jgi:hypothetical protein
VWIAKTAQGVTAEMKVRIHLDLKVIHCWQEGKELSYMEASNCLT